MKTTVKQIAAATFIAVLLMVGNVKATETRTTIERNLQLEEWMTDEIVWNTNSLNTTEYVVEVENSMKLESWMTDAQSWNTNNFFVEEVEMQMELESWMTNENR